MKRSYILFAAAVVLVIGVFFLFWNQSGKGRAFDRNETVVRKTFDTLNKAINAYYKDHGVYAHNEKTLIADGYLEDIPVYRDIAGFKPALGYGFSYMGSGKYYVLSAGPILDGVTGSKSYKINANQQEPAVSVSEYEKQIRKTYFQGRAKQYAYDLDTVSTAVAALFNDIGGHYEIRGTGMKLMYGIGHNFVKIHPRPGQPGSPGEVHVVTERMDQGRSMVKLLIIGAPGGDLSYEYCFNKIDAAAPVIIQETVRRREEAQKKALQKQQEAQPQALQRTQDAAAGIRE